MPDSGQILRCDKLLLNKALKTVEFEDQIVNLSPTSFELLSQLMQQAPSVVSVDELLKKVWNNKVVNRETVKQQIKSLRDQLGDAALMIESVRGFGYKIKSQDQLNINQLAAQKSLVKQPFIWVVVIGLFIMAGFLWYEFTSPKSKLKLPLKTAILPFKLLDSEDQDLVLLLQEDLTNMMSRQQDVKAISISAIEHAKYKNYSMEEYADQLDVDMLFEGSIHESTDGFAVNVRMVWTQNSIAVWRETISVEGKDRKSMVTKTRNTIKIFIQKKVSYIRQKND